EAKSFNRTFHESLRFPTPQGPVQVILKKRDRLNAFREIWSVIVDPADMFVDSSRPAAPGALIEFLKSGDPADKVEKTIQMNTNVWLRMIPHYSGNGTCRRDCLLSENHDNDAWWDLRGYRG